MDAMKPKVSIIVPTYERPTSIVDCLGSLAALDFPREDYEVIVADDGSSAPPVEAVERASTSMNVKLVRCEHRGPASARNAGLRTARGDWIAFTDDDCRPEPGWLRELMGAATIEPPSAAGGQTLNGIPTSDSSETSQLLIDYLYGYFNSDPDSGSFFTTNNLLFPRAELEALGGFDESFPLAASEDRDLCLRWVERGLRIRFAPRATVRHHHPLGALRFLRQHFTYGRGACQLHRRLAEFGRVVPEHEPMGFYIGILRYPFGRSSFHRACVQSGLMGLTQFAHLVGYGYERAGLGREALRTRTETARDQ